MLLHLLCSLLFVAGFLFFLLWLLGWTGLGLLIPVAGLGGIGLARGVDGSFFSSLFVLLLLVALACRAGLASMLCFVASPWRYESLLPTAAKVTKSAVRLLICPAGRCAPNL